MSSTLAPPAKHRHAAGDKARSAKVRQLCELMESPTLRGAVSSLLGPEFAWAPHRALHNSEPVEHAGGGFDPFENAPRMGKGSIAGSGWHQDGHSRAGRARWHRPRAVNVFYFAHDVPLAMGPTRLLAGSHLYANLHGIEARQVFMRAMPAGALVIAHFDLGHAGAPNRTDRSRYMLKFVALRQRNPRRAAGADEDARWHTPDGLLNPHIVPHAWEHSWRWLRGLPGAAPLADVAAALGPLPPTVVNSTPRHAERYDFLTLFAHWISTVLEENREGREF